MSSVPAPPGRCVRVPGGARQSVGGRGRCEGGGIGPACRFGATAESAAYSRFAALSFTHFQPFSMGVTRFSRFQTK